MSAFDSLVDKYLAEYRRGISYSDLLRARASGDPTTWLWQHGYTMKDVLDTLDSMRTPEVP